MEPTSSPDTTRPAPGLARFWQVRPDAGNPAPAPPADPFGLDRAARRSDARHPAGSRPSPGPPARDTDHSGRTEDRPAPAQDVRSQEPEPGNTSAGRDGAFGGFRLGGTGRFRFGGRNAGAGPKSAEAEQHAAGQAPDAAPENAPVADPADPGDSLVAEEPDGAEPPGATPADEPAARTPADADQDAADRAGPSDENGREDMNGRAGAPSYAHTGEASGPDGTTAPAAPGDAGDEPAPDGAPRAAAAGWASVPNASHPVTPTSGGPATGPVSGVPVSPGFGYPPVGGFTPDHPPLEPVSGAPHAAPEPAQPAAETPTSGAPVAGGTAAVPYPTVQIPATRTPPEQAVDRSSETVALPAATDGGYGFGPSGYSLGRSGEAFGVAAVTPAGPGAGSVTPPPAEFPSFPFPDSGMTGLAVGARRGADAEERSPARRSASLEDAEPVRRTGRRSADEETVATDGVAGARTIWDEDAARHFRAAWHEVKAEFVDDPVTALTRAHDLLTDAVNELTEVLLAERDDLDPLRGTDTPDTESMRMAMRGYREFLDRILSL